MLMLLLIVVHIIRQLFQIDASSYSFDRDVERSVGCHLSKVIERMADKHYAGRTDESTQAGWFGGFTLERVLAHQAIEAELEQNRAGLWRPGELFWCHNCGVVLGGHAKHKGKRMPAGAVHCLERKHVGIFGTPDAVMIKLWALKEWKFTKKSMRSAGGDRLIAIGAEEAERERSDYEHISVGMWPWIVQMKSYCWMLGKLFERPMLKSVLEVLFIEGDYGLTTRDYTTARYWLRFDERELDEGWDALVSHAIDGGMLEAK